MHLLQAQKISAPGLDGLGPDEDQPARIAQGWLEIFRPVLTEITNRHAARDLDPFAAHIGPLDYLRRAFDQNLLGNGNGIDA